MRQRVPPPPLLEPSTTRPTGRCTPWRPSPCSGAAQGGASSQVTRAASPVSVPHLRRLQTLDLSEEPRLPGLCPWLPGCSCPHFCAWWAVPAAPRPRLLPVRLLAETVMMNHTGEEGLGRHAPVVAGGGWHRRERLPGPGSGRCHGPPRPHPVLWAPFDPGGPGWARGPGLNGRGALASTVSAECSHCLLTPAPPLLHPHP